MSGRRHAAGSIPSSTAEHCTPRCQEAGLGYAFMGDALGGRPTDPSCYDSDGRVQYDRLAETDAFKAAIRNVIRRTGDRRLAIMCSEPRALALPPGTADCPGVDGRRSGRRSHSPRRWPGKPFRYHGSPAGQVQYAEGRRHVLLPGTSHRQCSRPAGAAGSVCRKIVGNCVTSFSIVPDYCTHYYYVFYVLMATRYLFLSTSPRPSDNVKPGCCDGMNDNR